MAYQTKAIITAITLNLCLGLNTVSAENHFSLKENIKADYKHFYSKERLSRLGVSFLGSGLIANTDMDQNFRNWYQREQRNSTTDKYAKKAKTLGKGLVMVPLSLLAGSAFYLNADSKIC